MSTDQYLDRVYDAKTYNCLHLTVEVWRDLTGGDLRARLDGLLHGAVAARRVGRVHVGGFRRVAAPLDPCVVLFQRPGSAPHIGVYMRGRVLHITHGGPQFVPLHIAALGFQRTSFLLPS